MRKIAVIFLVLLTLLSPAYLVFAKTTDELQSELEIRKSEINSVNSKIGDYQKRLAELSNRQAGLEKDVALISNDVEIAQLDIEAIELTIDAQRLQVEILDRQVRDATAQLKRQKMYLRDLVVEVYRSKETTPVQVVFSSSGMHEALSSLEQLETLSGRLDSQLEDTRSLRGDLQKRQTEQQEKVSDLEDLGAELNAHILILEQKKHAVDVLLAETNNSEAQYRVLMSESRQEQQSITSRILGLQDEIQKRIREEGGAEAEESDQTSITSPLKSYIITATFHDPTYPFRNVQEHTGLDMAASMGTPIYAAAPGIVSWVRPGNKGYGNYVMIIHDNGLSTLYGHMSAFATTQDKYVSRGELIGYVGSTGFSTGPHLHFEVRLNGVPVNPQAYLQ